MALVSYSSSSDDENEDDQPPVPKIMKISTTKKLPLPSVISSMKKVLGTAPIDDPSKHDGRVRSFEHERGNWATLIFIPDELQAMIQNAFETSKISLKPSKDIHLSLTKTVILRYHWIKLFEKSLHESLASCEHVYVNDDKTRTFIGLTASDIYFEKLRKLMVKMDKLMNEFQLDTFYKNPSFHASIMWCLGDQESLIRNILPELNARFTEMKNESLEDFQIKVNQIQCKIGNKNFKFQLK